jgi:mannose-6-phosphate isomerase-like protein (cupin superfamily)
VWLDIHAEPTNMPERYSTMPEMRTRFICLFAVMTGAILSIIVGATLAKQLANTINSKVKTQQEAMYENFNWGTFHTYYQGDTYGTKDVLAGVAVIKPGMEIHPPHQHAEEEYLMVTAGQGTWHLNGKDFTAQKGGITNTGTTLLTFVVWKWNTKGLAVPTQPSEANK